MKKGKGEENGGSLPGILLTKMFLFLSNELLVKEVGIPGERVFRTSQVEKGRRTLSLTGLKKESGQHSNKTIGSYGGSTFG